MDKLSIEKIEEEIRNAKPEEQRAFLAKLPHLLKISIADLGWQKLSEPSFEFWDNEEDRIYDSL